MKYRDINNQKYHVMNDMEQHNLQPYPVREVIQRYFNKEEGPFWESTFEDR